MDDTDRTFERLKRADFETVWFGLKSLSTAEYWVFDRPRKMFNLRPEYWYILEKQGWTWEEYDKERNERFN